LTFALIWMRPRAIPRWSVIVSFALTMFVIIVSITVQIPIQRELYANGLSIPLVEKLILTDWLRKVPATFNAILFLWMMSKVLITTERGDA
jgi:hypothetical protein